MAPIRRIINFEIQDVSDLHQVQTKLGEVDVTNFSTVTFFCEYKKGNEDGIYIIPFMKANINKDNYQFQVWNGSPILRPTLKKFEMTETNNYMITLDVRGVRNISIEEVVIGETSPTGSLKVEGVKLSE